MGKRATYAHEMKRTDAWLANPDDLIIEDDEKAPLYDVRGTMKPDEAMVRNMMSLGTGTSAILIRKEGDRAKVIAGRSRVLACREANRRLAAQGAETLRLFCLVHRGDESKMVGLMISENELRTADSAINRAKKAQRFLDSGKTMEEAAVVFGCSVKTLESHLALLECSAAVRAAVESAEVPATVAVKLAKLSHAAQNKALAEMVASGSTRGRRGQAAAEEARNGRPAKAAKIQRAKGRRVLEKMLAAMDSGRYGPDTAMMRDMVAYLLGELPNPGNDSLVRLIEEVEQ